MSAPEWSLTFSHIYTYIHIYIYTALVFRFFGPPMYPSTTGLSIRDTSSLHNAHSYCTVCAYVRVHQSFLEWPTANAFREVNFSARIQVKKIQSPFACLTRPSMRCALCTTLYSCIEALFYKHALYRRFFILLRLSLIESKLSFLLLLDYKITGFSMILYSLYCWRVDAIIGYLWTFSIIMRSFQLCVLIFLLPNISFLSRVSKIPYLYLRLLDDRLIVLCLIILLPNPRPIIRSIRLNIFNYLKAILVRTPNAET
jgi:hypothetical protein